MKNIAFVFPGQGAQYVGMGNDLANSYTVAREVFDQASECLGFDLLKLCYKGPEEELLKTENTQPAILTTSIAILRVIEGLGLKAQVSAGLSLGEYTALVYSGALSFEEAVKLVKKRGKFMQEAVPEGKGTMAAIVGLDRITIQDVINEASNMGVVEGANFNCPGQVVISGEIAATEEACKIATTKGAKRALKLAVSAPFHSSLLKPAGDMLSIALEEIKIGKFRNRVISNVTADYINSEDEIKDLLVKQVYKPVLWEDTIERMLNDGIEVIVEIGPGKTLTAFSKKIAKKMGKNAKFYSIEDSQTLNAFIEAMKEGEI